MACKILSVQGTVFDGPVKSVRAPASLGEVCILPGHIPFVTSLRKGRLTLETASESKSFEIEQGVLEVMKDQVTVIAPQLGRI